MIIKWAVSNWLGKPEMKEYSRETEHFYIHARGRGRDSKISRYKCYFDTEAEALDFIAKKKEIRARSKDIDRVKLHAVELLEALEDARSKIISQLILLCCDEEFIQKETAIADTAIAKAKGLTQ